MHTFRTLLMTGALLAPLSLFAGETRNLEPDLVVQVRVGKSRAVQVEGARDVRVSEKGIADVALGEPNQLIVDGLQPGEVSAQVVRKGHEKNFKLVVQVVR